MLYLISYDIPDDRRRVRLAKTLQDYGGRVQYSVFECIMDHDLLTQMVAKIDAVIDAKEDSVRIYALCAGCVGHIQILGQGEVSADKDVYIL